MTKLKGITQRVWHPCLFHIISICFLTSCFCLIWFTAQGDNSAESLDCPQSSIVVHDRNEEDSSYDNGGEKFVRVRRPRSAGDISESVVHLNSFVVGGGGGGFSQD